MAQAQFEVAAANVKSAPQSMSAWDEAEELARAAERPDDMIALYRDVLQKGLDPQLVEVIGERAAAFCDEWFGDEPKVAEGILGRVLDLAPQSEQALQRLSVLYTQSERWNDLLRLYDRALIAVKDQARRIKLLREAAQLAKDVANQPEKAIGYQQRLLPLTPDDVQLQTSLERLLERHERWADLIALWEGRLDRLTKAERERSRARIAAVQLDSLRDSARALATVRVMLAGADDDREATGLLERIIEAPHTQKKERDGALDLLRAHYDATGRPREVIRVLERVIEIDPSASRALREEAGARLSELDDDGAAMDHYAALLALTPDSSVTQEKLRQLAQRSSNYARYADGVASAAAHAETPARRVELLAEAARTRLDLLDDATGAIELYQQALALEGAGAKEQLQVGRLLSELYSRVERPRERFEILTRLAELEPAPATRKQVIGDAARMAESLGEHDRALALWQQRVDAEPGDHAALDAIVALLERVERWPALIDALERRAGSGVSPAQQRADLTRVAVIARERLHDGERALAAWQRVTAIFGDDGETVEALSQLLGEAGRWRELAELLERTSGKDVERTTARLNRLGLALAQHLHEPARALAAYRAALAIEPTNPVAQAGLEALLAATEQRAAAADALAASYRERADWAGFLRLVPARLADAADDRARLAILREAAHVALTQTNEPAAGLAHLAQALPLAPRDGLMLGQILDLADRTGGHATADRALATAITALGSDAQEAARLRVQRAGLLERHLGDEASALSELFTVLQVDPGNAAAVAGVVRLAPRHGQWPLAANAILAHAAGKERVDDKLLDGLEQAAVGSGPEALDALATGFDKAASSITLPPAVAAAVWTRLAGWHRDHRNDPTASMAAYDRALAAGGDRAEPLRAVVALARAAGPSARLLDILRRLADAVPRDLDILVEAADTASNLADRVAALTIFGQVLGRATAAWRGSAPIRSTRTPESVARWAIEGLVELHRGAGRVRAAVDLLGESARLPFGATVRRELRLRAAQLAAAELGDRAAAIDVYRGLLAEDAADVEVIERLGALLEEDGRTAELLGLRQLQLAIESDPPRRLALRLDVARLVGLVEEKGGRLEALQANLADVPGHEPSIDALSALYAGKGQHKQLADLLEQQAATLEGAGDTTRAARLWSRAASTAEHETREVERAIAAYKRVVNLAPSADAYRALARLQLGRGQPAQAVPWFESLLATMTGKERLGVVHQLARAPIAAGPPDRAISAIEANLDDKEPATELRLLLAELYREGQHWEPLARHLTRSLGMFVEDGRSGALAREAAAIYTDKLDQPAKAIPALERALALDPTDRKLRAHLAAGLRTAGQLPEARAQLSELIEGFGRRRSPERAVLHVELAKVARAEGKLDEALAEMESASRMDASNARIQRELAELAREAGQLELSERTYRSLLLVVRRQPPGDDEQAVGQSEVLYELAALARARGEADQAKELLESAVDAAIQSDAEVRRLRRSLLAHGEAETLLRVLQLRLTRSNEGGSQARLLGDMAAALDGPLGRPAEALDASLRAVQAAPDRLELHDRARELARRLGETAKYVDTVEIVVDRLRRKDDPPLVAALLLRAGEALEHDAGDREAASAMYRRVESLGVRLADAYSAQARVAGALGDTDQQARALDNMLKLAAADGEGGAAQVDALYRLAEIFVATSTRRTQGIELIERALASEPRWVQAGRVLRAAVTAEPSNPRVMQLYDRVARNSGDAELRLDYLERRSQQPGVTGAQVREAVELALDTGQDARAEALLTRAIEQARGSAEGPAEAVWAMLQLADRRIDAGELSGARDLIYDAIGSAEPRQVDPLIGKLARKAAASPDHHGLAADMFELLRERAPGDRGNWQPLLELYRAMGDGDRVASLISITLPHIADAGERGELRRGHAVYLAGLGRAHDAADILRDALLDQPDDVEAAALLEANLRAVDDHEGLAEFLTSRFEDALRRGNPATTVDVAHRLGALLEAQGEPAARIYRTALAVAPDDRELLRKVVAGLTTDDDPAEAVALMERLLAVETSDRAPALASHLASAYQQAEDWDGVQRTLELAHRAAPDEDAIHGRLEQFYRDRHAWRPLADLMIGDAARTEDHAVAVMRLREAAGVYGEQLGSPAEAARALALARSRRADSPTLVSELAAALVHAGDTAGAIAAIGEAIDGPSAPIGERGRLDLLMQRAALRATVGDDDGAVADLDAAYQLDPGRSSPALADALERMRNAAIADGELDRERTATLRLSTLLTELGDPERARELLVTWIERAPTDPDPLYLLRDMDAAIEHWDGVIAACTRLAYVVEGEPQVQAALDIASASAQAGRPDEAIPVLEMVHQAQPGVTALRDKLRELYAQAGAHRELAAVLIADAEHADDVATRFELYKRAAELLLYSAGDPAAAAGPAGQASALVPDDHGAAMLYVDVLIASGQTEAAAHVLDGAIAAQKKRSPELATMQQRMGRVQGMLGDRDGHLSWLKKAFDVDRKSGEIAAELAQLATELGDYELALKPLRAISLMENPQPVSRPMALLWEAKIEHARGNRAKAELWAKKALREDPEFADAQQFLEELGG
jgi:tetratricopeptide (TPR) repeat protein